MKPVSMKRIALLFLAFAVGGSISYVLGTEGIMGFPLSSVDKTSMIPALWTWDLVLESRVDYEDLAVET